MAGSSLLQYRFKRRKVGCNGVLSCNKGDKRNSAAPMQHKIPLCTFFLQVSNHSKLLLDIGPCLERKAVITDIFNAADTLQLYRVTFDKS